MHLHERHVIEGKRSCNQPTCGGRTPLLTLSVPPACLFDDAVAGAVADLLQAHPEKAPSCTPSSNPSAERTPAAVQPSHQAAGQKQRSEGEQQLCAGDRVEVLAADNTVAAFGCVMATQPGSLLSDHPDDSTTKVSLEHHNT